MTAKTPFAITVEVHVVQCSGDATCDAVG